ncbi:MAG: hypothetical protein CMK09_11875 [Ponticaulis sp.]|nr:hypothetical protein [Ponticaulis sp.]|tara:strand:- start:11439 stop:11819 length:381 start_codon:yes stop_codon:yes gene_type:complete
MVGCTTNAVWTEQPVAFNEIDAALESRGLHTEIVAGCMKDTAFESGGMLAPNRTRIFSDDEAIELADIIKTSDSVEYADWINEFYESRGSDDVGYRELTPQQEAQEFIEYHGKCVGLHEAMGCYEC